MNGKEKTTSTGIKVEIENTQELGALCVKARGILKELIEVVDSINGLELKVKNPFRG